MKHNPNCNEVHMNDFNITDYNTVLSFLVKLRDLGYTVPSLENISATNAIKALVSLKERVRADKEALRTRVLPPLQRKLPNHLTHEAVRATMEQSHRVYRAY